MRKIFYFLCLIACCIAHAADTKKPVATKKSTPAKSIKNTDATTACVEKIAKNFMQQYGVPGMAIVLYSHGKPYTFHFGCTNVTDKKPVTNQTLFEIGSMSKIFTCLLVAQEVLDSRMCLDAPLSTYVPALRANKKLDTITLEKLGTHTSTLPFHAPEKIQSTDALIAHIAQWKPANKPLRWQYSNPGVELLRIALEQSLHKNINELLIERILKPLNMSPIGVIVPAECASLCATSHTKQGEKTHAWNHPFLIGSAAMRASSADMLCFLKAALCLPGTPKKIKQAMQLTQTAHLTIGNEQQGLIWRMRQPENFHTFKSTVQFLEGCDDTSRIDPAKRCYNPNLFMHKTGTTNGFHAYIAVIPGQQRGVVVMMNRMLHSGFAKIKKLGNEILFKTSEKLT